jgi:hypothetical protein
VFSNHSNTLTQKLALAVQQHATQAASSASAAAASDAAPVSAFQPAAADRSPIQNVASQSGCKQTEQQMCQLGKTPACTNFQATHALSFGCTRCIQAQVQSVHQCLDVNTHIKNYIRILLKVTHRYIIVAGIGVILT